MSKFRIGDKVKHLDDDNFPVRTVAGVDKHLDVVSLEGKAGWFPAEQFERVIQGEVGEMKVPPGGYVTYSTTWPEDGTVLTFDPANGPPVFVETPKADETARRKAMPVCTGVLDYFPDALLAVSQLSKFGNDKYNPGEPLHHARGKSMDHADALVRHHMARGTIDPDTGLSHSVGVAWRALAQLQEELEAAGAPLARGAKK